MPTSGAPRGAPKPRSWLVFSVVSYLPLLLIGGLVVHGILIFAAACTGSGDSALTSRRMVSSAAHVPGLLNAHPGGGGGDEGSSSGESATALARRLLASLRNGDASALDLANPGEHADVAKALAAALLTATKVGEGMLGSDAASEAVRAVTDELPLGAAAVNPFTQQTCYLDVDESETCMFETLCFDGRSPVVLVDTPFVPEGGDPREPVEVIDPVNDCYDYRYYEPSVYSYAECHYDRAGARPYVAEDHPADVKHDSPLMSRTRWWGPHNRHAVFFREVASSRVFAPDGVQISDGPFEHELVPGLRIAKRMVMEDGNLTVDWTDSAVYLAALSGQAWSNPFHWLAAMGPLYAARRGNATGSFGDSPQDGWVSSPSRKSIGNEHLIAMEPRTRNRAEYRVGNRWPYPPMDVVVGISDGGRELSGVDALWDWMGSTLRLMVQPHTKVYFNDLLAAYSPEQLLCTRRAVVPSHKPKMFSGGSDAWVFRQRAYLMSGLTDVPSHPKLPPRVITVVDRAGGHGRIMYNKQELMRAVAETGLEYRVIARMDALTFAEQVAAMAGTGILIAPHGAHLANAMFLPARAAVVEIFPPLMKKNTYRNLAHLFNLHYFPVVGRQLLPGSAVEHFGVKLFGDTEFRDECISLNVSCFDSLVASYCNWAAKTYPIIVPPNQLRDILRDAVDAISAYSWLHPDWRAIVEARNIPPPTRLAWFDGWNEPPLAYTAPTPSPEPKAAG